MIRLALIDAHPVVRAGLRHWLAAAPEFALVAEGGSAREALDIVRAERADVVVLELELPGGGGVDVLAAIRARAPNLPVLVFSTCPEDPYATTVLRLGAQGFLPKDCEGEELLRALRTVHLGRRYISAGTAERLADRLCEREHMAPHDQLSERELQVFLRLARGETIGHLASHLSLSVKTVSTYRTRVMEKMLLHSNSDLTYYALKHGLIA
jgi:DNA-binding NarL/FixJ family response regulator